MSLSFPLFTPNPNPNPNPLLRRRPTSLAAIRRTNSPSSAPKPPPNPRSKSDHPAFKISRLPRFPPESDEQAGISVGENGVAYKVKDAPFEFQYSYTETPKVKPLALREPLFVPFGPTTMPRPWTGRAPLPPSKKKLPEFDSFNLPPSGKKGVKPVQAPGPFLPDSGPKYHAASREEILGEPLTREEVKELVMACLKGRRQLNMGRDGLTHNMLDNIHAHWKRRRVCKIKCKGVCTVDMDNVRRQLEEKTGGKIIYGKGGVLFLYRGRNYNYRTRPRYPLMLWKPTAPVYPRLIQRVPDGLTLEEATEMRKKGRQLPPICQLGKNGVYSNLVKQVKEAFEACEIVRINCTTLNKNDCRKIGAKLQDLVPCVLLSFEYEHILMWRGKDWKSSFLPSGADHITASEPNDDVNFSSVMEDQLEIDQIMLDSDTDGSSDTKLNNQTSTKEMCMPASDALQQEASSYPYPSHMDVGNRQLSVNSAASAIDSSTEASGFLIVTPQDSDSTASVHKDSQICDETFFTEQLHQSSHDVNKSVSETAELENGEAILQQLTTDLHVDSSRLNHIDSGTSLSCSVCDSELGMGEKVPSQDIAMSSKSCLEGVLDLLNLAVESGAAQILDDASVDANIVYEKSVALSRTAPPGPEFQRRTKKTVPTTKQKNGEKIDDQETMVESVSISEQKPSAKKLHPRRRANSRELLTDIVPHGSLGVDELARLLA